jgi:hypothetical protein
MVFGNSGTPRGFYTRLISEYERAPWRLLTLRPSWREKERPAVTLTVLSLALPSVPAAFAGPA